MPSVYLLGGLLLILQLIVTSVVIPSAAGSVLGVALEGGTFSQRVLEQLVARGGQWKEYPSREALERAVLSGEADSGFYLSALLDEAAEEALSPGEAGDSQILLPDMTGAVTWLYTTSSVKGAAAKETVYAVVLEAMTPAILRRGLASGALLKETDERAEAALLAAYEEVLKRDVLFRVRLERFGHEEERDGEEESERSPSKELAGVLLFGTALLLAAELFRESHRSVSGCLGRGRVLYRACVVFAPLIILGGLEGVYLLIRRETTIAGCLRLLPVLLLTALLSSLLAGLFRHEAVYLFLSVMLLALSGILTLSAGGLPYLAVLRPLAALLPSSWISGVL